MSLGRRISWTQQQNEISCATRRSDFDMRRCLGYPKTRRPRAKADNCTKHSGRAHNVILSLRNWGCSPHPEGNLGENHRLLLVAGPEARCTTLRGVLPSLRAVHSAQPNPENGLQADENWRSRKLPGYGHSRRYGFHPVNPERQSQHSNPHRLLHAFRSSSTSCRSICRSCHCISYRSLYYGIRYPAPYTNRSRS